MSEEHQLCLLPEQGPCSVAGARQECSSSLPGICQSGTQSCDPFGDEPGNNLWSRCVPHESARVETCNGLDDDCDGNTDEEEEVQVGCATGAFATAGQCVDGRCVTTCANNRLECDGSGDNGCEAELGSLAACTRCGDSCGWRCASTGCGDAIAIDAGGTLSGDVSRVAQTCARTADSKVYCWGAAPGPNGLARRVDGIETAMAISIGAEHGCALEASGAVRCWGGNSEGQLGIVSSDPVVLVSDLTTAATHIAAGGLHSCAATQEGVFCWGSNRFKQVDPGRTPSVNPFRPVRVFTPTENVLRVSVGFSSSCVATASAVTCWGHGYNSDAPLAMEFPDISDLQVGAGWTLAGELAQDFACVISAGRVTCWGSNLSQPELVSDSLGAEKLAVGSAHACFLRARKVFCWGANVSGQLGSNPADTRIPTEVPDLSDVIDVAAGPRHTCALRANGEMRCWGANEFGQLGNDTTTDSMTPVTVLPPRQ